LLHQASPSDQFRFFQDPLSAHPHDIKFSHCRLQMSNIEHRGTVYTVDVLSVLKDGDSWA
jgi:hypothetical protein